MRFLIRNCWLLLVIVYATSASALQNQLNDHPSPYLALHAGDPVAWQDWTPQTVETARQQGKLLYMSIGYFSCHWCHVMQRESYQNQEIANILNQNFIPVKVDRELEPALDARMIDFVQATQGRAGWPLNVFLTPDGHPLYAVLYLPPQNFKQVLQRLNQLWLEDKDNLVALAKRESPPARGPGTPILDQEAVESYARTIIENLERIADDMNGGFGNQSKFPMVPQMEFLLSQYQRYPSPPIREFLVLTLDQMAGNGMYDHVGDGFFRYTVDPNWETPHFEKMLYDNALLSLLYSRAAVALDVPRYEQVARRTLDFMLRDMATRSGAMVASFSAVDADDVEGGYYLWQKTELASVLTPDENRAVTLAWGIDGPLSFAAGYLPIKGKAVTEIADQLKIDAADVETLILSARKKLLLARDKRVLPTDTKLLAAWNGLALAAFAHAGRVFKDERYIAGARRIRDYIVNTLWRDNSLHRAVDGARAIGKSSLQDYAYVGAGLMEWARLTGDEEDREWVSKVVKQAWHRFYKTGWRMAEDSLITAEQTQDLISDGPMPSPAALVASISLQLTALGPDGELRAQALAALNSGHEELGRNGFWHVSHINAMVLALSQ